MIVQKPSKYIGLQKKKKKDKQIQQQKKILQIFLEAIKGYLRDNAISFT